MKTAHKVRRRAKYASSNVVCVDSDSKLLMEAQGDDTAIVTT